MVYTVAVPSELASLRSAREAVEAAVAAWHAPVEPALVALLLSEVLANAMEHGEPPIVVTADWDGHRLRISVADGSTAEPVHRHPDPHDTAGRGIWLVEHGSSAWGVDCTPTGKSVWFELRPRTDRSPDRTGPVEAARSPRPSG